MHRVDALGAGIEPFAAARGGQGRVRHRVHRERAQLPERARARGRFQRAPTRHRVGRIAGEFHEHGKAALLRIDQVQPVLVRRRVQPPARECRGHRRAFLARQFLALQEMEHRHQPARDARLGGRVGRLEHHGQQRRDQLDEGARAGVGLDAPRQHLGAQAGQGVQALQCVGDAAVETRAVADAAGAGVQAVQRGTQRRFAFAGAGDLFLQRFAELVTDTQPQVGQAAFALQRVDALAGAPDQRAGAHQLLQLVDLALPGGDEEGGAGSHAGLSRKGCASADVGRRSEAGWLGHGAATRGRGRRDCGNCKSVVGKRSVWPRPALQEARLASGNWQTSPLFAENVSP